MSARKLDNMDYDSIKYPNYGNGFYVVSGNLHQPFEVGWTYIILISFDDGFSVQIALGDANTKTPELKIRTCVASEWGEWISK
jgi:hypothetical protein